MELKQVQCVLAVVEAGSFSAAAEDLYISQSSLSKLIMALEKELGVRLFDRTHRQIALTPAGEAFLPHARSLDAAYRGLLADMVAHQANPALTIVAIPVIAQYDIPSYVAQFRSAHPDIALTLEEREASAILPALHNHQFDMAFVRDNYLDATQFVVKQITGDHMVAVVSTRHRYATRACLALEELADENHIMFDKGTVVHELAVEACRAAGFEPRIFYASLRVESVLGPGGFKQRGCVDDGESGEISSKSRRCRYPFARGDRQQHRPDCAQRQEAGLAGTSIFRFRRNRQPRVNRKLSTSWPIHLSTNCALPAANGCAPSKG